MNIKNIFRSFYIVVTLTAVGCNSNSQEAKNATTEAINTQEITWQPTIEDAFAKAKAQNKLVFVECFLPTCPVCMSMEPFFKKPEVATKYNTNFINYKMDLSKPDAKPYLDGKGIYLPSFPMFLFFDGDGNLVHKDEVETSVASFNAVADKVLDPAKRSSNFKKRFADGDRGVPFLIDYASYARVVMDTAANIAAASALFDGYPKQNLGTEESWKITKKAVTDLDNGFAKFWFDNVTKAAEFEKKDGHAGNEQNILGGIIQSSLYGARGKTYNSAKLLTVKKYMGLVGAAQYADGVTWEFEVKALIKEGKAPQALPVGSKMVSLYGTNGQSLVYITKVFNDNYPDKAYTATAKSWLARAKPLLKEPKDLAEYYYESARLNQKNGDLAVAKADAQQAQSNAVQATMDLGRFTTLTNSLK